MRAVESSHARISRFLPVLRTRVISRHQRFSLATMRANSVSVMRSISDSKSKRNVGVNAGMALDPSEFEGHAQDGVDRDYGSGFASARGRRRDGLIVEHVAGPEEVAGGGDRAV